MKSFIHKNNLDERQKSYIETVYPAHPSRLTRPIFLNDILSPSAFSNSITQLVGRPKSPLVLLNVPGSPKDLLEESERDTGRVKRRGGVVTLKKLNGKIKFHKAMRRRSCCCKWCGGISEFEEKHKDIVGNVEKAVKARTVLAINDLLSENSTSRRSSARDALREVLPEATILRRKNQRKSKERNNISRKMMPSLEGLKAKGKNGFSCSFHVKSSNRKSVLSDESSLQILNDSNTKMVSPQPDLDKLEEESPAEGESPQQNPFPTTFPPKKAFSRSTTEPNLFKRRSKLPSIQAKRGSEIPRNNTFLSQLDVSIGDLPSGNKTQNNFEGSPIYRTLNGGLPSTPDLKTPPQTLKVAELVKKQDDIKISSFSPLPAKSMGFLQKGNIRTRTKVTSIKIDVDESGKDLRNTTPMKGSGSVTSIIKISTIKSPAQDPRKVRHVRTSSSIQLKTDPNGEDLERARSQEFLIPAVKSPKEKTATSGAHKALSKILKKSQKEATIIYTKDIDNIRKTGMKFYQYSPQPQIQRGQQKSLSNFPSVHMIPKLNMTEFRINPHPQKKAQTMVSVVKYKDEKERIRANDKKATWLVGNFGGPKKSVLLKSFALDHTSQELKLKKKIK